MNALQHTPTAGRLGAAASAAPEGVWARRVLWGVLALSVVRALLVFVSPIELYPDEAQYWLWSRRLAWGYYSKPPMTAWLIAASTYVGGDGEAWIRLPAVVVHGLAALVQFRIGARLFGPREGAAAAALYSLMPGVVLSSSVMATDAPLLLFSSAALWAYAEMWRARDTRARLWAAAGLGVALGLAFLSKYAAAYVAGGLLLHALSSKRARALWAPAELAAAIGLTAALLAPNLAWNAAHRFATFVHTAENAQTLQRNGLLSVRGAAGFLFGQLGVFGPVPFLVLVGGTAACLWRRRVAEEEQLLLCLTLPPIFLVLVEAILARANANWAAAAYVAGCPLVAAWLVRARAWRTITAALVSQGVAAALFFAGAASPGLADALGFSGGLKRARGRAEETLLVASALQAAQASGAVTAVAVDRRFEFNTLAYYGRALFGVAGGPPLRMWVREDRPHNQAEQESPLRPGPEGRRVLFVNDVDDFATETRADFAAIESDRNYAARLDAKRRREFSIFVGREFRPRPRDPTTGRPTPP